MNHKKSALGKGLSALLDNSEISLPVSNSTHANETAGVVNHLTVAHIEVNPFQPRHDFKEEELISLADSIRVHGISK